MINLNKDFLEFAQELNKHGVEYMIVGAYAMSVQGYSRTTGDIDFFVRADPVNAGRVYETLKAFGAYVGDVSAEEFAKENFVFQIGVVPVRIDVITSISGVSFEAAFPSRTECEIEGTKIPFLSRKYLIINKKASGREKDLHDANELERLNGNE